MQGPVAKTSCVFGSSLPAKLSADEVSRFLCGIRSTFSFFQQQSSEIVDYFSAKMSKLEVQPIRILLRDTKEYYAYLSCGGVAAPSLLAEESEQLQRGDIPYFWGTLGDRAIRYWKEPGLSRPIERLSRALEPKLARAFCDPRSLLEPRRLHRLEKQVLMECAYRLLDRASLPFEDGRCTFQTERGFLRVAVAGLLLQAEVRSET